MSVGVAIGTHYADQIRSPVVSHRVKTAAFVVERGLPAPLPDKRFRRTEKQGVLIDMKTPIFMFGPPVEEEPYSWNVENAHRILEAAAEDARKGGVWTPSRRETDFIGNLIRQQAEERALADVRSKEMLMLNEGLSPDEVADLTKDEKERLARKYRSPEIRNAVQAAVDAEHAPRVLPPNLDSMTRSQLIAHISSHGRVPPGLRISNQSKEFLLSYAKHMNNPGQYPMPTPSIRGVRDRAAAAAQPHPRPTEPQRARTRARRGELEAAARAGEGAGAGAGAGAAAGGAGVVGNLFGGDQDR